MLVEAVATVVLGMVDDEDGKGVEAEEGSGGLLATALRLGFWTQRAPRIAPQHKEGHTRTQKSPSLEQGEGREGTFTIFIESIS